MIKIAFIPIDNRPVCSEMCADIANFSSDIELLLPPKEYLGGLTNPAQTGKLLDWLENLPKIDILVVSLDTIAYGGLVSSRRTDDNFETIKTRIEHLKNIIIKKNIKTYACSSIMRISNNNCNEEEKEYWNLWGKKIFDYSYNLHKAQKTQSYDCNAKFSCIRQVIPASILEDYLKTRKRNFEINKLYLDWQKKGILKYLVYSKDDCAQFGLNVMEADELEEAIRHDNLDAIVKTGADEIPLSLLSRAFSETKNKKVKFYPKFLRPDCTDLISKYEDVSIYNSVKGQIELCGAELCETDTADIILFVNNFKNEQGELVMGVGTEMFEEKFLPPDRPYAIADVSFANGADNNFIKAFFENEINLNNLYGYSGWNTSANTIGSVLCSAVIKFLSNKYEEEKFKRAQFIRLADDWAYQANCREKLKSLRNEPDIHSASKIMEPYVKKISEKFNFHPKNVNYKFPWDRFFEIEIIPEN